LITNTGGKGGGDAGNADGGGVHTSESQYHKQIKILENRLEKANQKFNESIASNKLMRESIDNLRKEKSIFENVYNKLEK
jgi:hypothetical protein